MLRRALEQAAAAEYDPEPAEVPVQQSDVPADVTEAVKKERERFAGFQPDPANTEFGKYMHEQTNISGRNADRVIKRKAKERLAKFSVDKRQKPN